MNELNIFFTGDETTSATSAPAETSAADPTVTKDTSFTQTADDAPILTIGAVEEGENTVLLAADSAAPDETTATTQANLGFEPMNFVDNLQYMGVGMLTIFIVIGVIILTTSLINWIFSRKKG